MNSVNARTIRDLYEKLPFCAFEHICDELPDLLDMEECKCEYVHFHDFDEDTDADSVAQDYGFDSYYDMVREGPYCTTFTIGMLVIE